MMTYYELKRVKQNLQAFEDVAAGLPPRNPGDSHGYMKFYNSWKKNGIIKRKAANFGGKKLANGF